MQLIKSCFLFFIISFGFDPALAQQKTVLKDTTRIYADIETYSKRSKFTKFIYTLIFNPVKRATLKKNTSKKVYRKLIRKPYSVFEGKIIRHINIETLDPFGYSIGDTTVVSQNLVSKTGNSLHIKTLGITIRNLLLFRQNQLFDSLIVKESERLVRSRPYIRDVSFFVTACSKNSDSIDVAIRALDIWSILPDGSASTSGFAVNLTDKNFLGLGHSFQNVYEWNSNKQTNSYVTNYSISNFRNTYISTTLHYNILGNEKYNRSLIFERPFFSPFAKWAAGISLSQLFRQDSIRVPNLLFVPQRFKFNSQDYWTGHAIHLYKGNSEYDRTTNLITAVRYYQIRYLERPTELIDIQHMFADENLYLTSIGISTRKYVQDRYIFKYGVVEDVPMGKVFSVTMGIQKRNNIVRPYVGARISFGNYYSWGYFGYNCEYGTFLRNSKSEQGVLSLSANYFTGLKEIGKWKFRQFVKPQLTLGINRFDYDSLTLNQGFGIDGFNSKGSSGTSRAMLTLQTQGYAPWNFIGFRFGPFITWSMGLLGDPQNRFKNSKVYSQIGIGLLIKNENLVLNTFQVSIAFYPVIPGVGQNIFKPNSYKTSDFGLADFEIGKPSIVIFQ
ncbi:MAG: hypothetical protein WCP85_25530 [Mariniphaga sp.]